MTTEFVSRETQAVIVVAIVSNRIWADPPPINKGTNCSELHIPKKLAEPDSKTHPHLPLP
jgi:hypothetical protein